MIWFWLGFFALVALLLFLDLGVVHRRAKEMSLRTAAAWTAVWVALGLSFSGVVYLMYEHNWGGVHLAGCPPGHADGTDAAVTYVSAYLLEQALSVDNIFVMSLLFTSFRVPVKYQHRVLFWGILGAIVFRVTMLGGGAFTIRVDGRRALTTVAVCLVVIELTDIVFALDSIPAVLSVSQETFIMITSNIFAIMGLRSLYFVLAGAMAQFKYLKIALAILLIVIGGKMVIHHWWQMSHVISLALIAGIIGVGVLASVLFGPDDKAKPAD